MSIILQEVLNMMTGFYLFEKTSLTQIETVV